MARVLAVDDDRDTRETTRFLLVRWGHEAHVAGSGAEALEALTALRPDVVLLDLALGGRPNGYEVARQIRLRGGKQPVLVCVSGHGRAEDRCRSREAGFDLHLLKPADPEEVKRLLEMIQSGLPPP